VAACYPLDLFDPDDERVRDLCDFIVDKCMNKGAFFHDISHSGINPYLCLHLAQSLMRMRDIGFAALTDRVTELASPTGQWPEAINPRTGTGCMGDGQHIWASAEYVMMMVNSIVYERDTHLVIGAGILPKWLENGCEISGGPIHTVWGPIEVHVSSDSSEITVEWEGRWHSEAPRIEVQVPGAEPTVAQEDSSSVVIYRRGNR
jgi:hypothetical protein